MSRANNFDALRMLAASVVIFGHAHPLSATPDKLVLGESVQSVAVKIFFVISGYLVARSWQSDPNYLRFLWRRTLRLFPALLLLLLLTVCVLGPMFTTLPVPEYLRSEGVSRYFWSNLVLSPVYALPGVFADNPYPTAVNGSLWSLPVEFFMYLLLPVVSIVASLLGGRRLFTGMALLLVASAFIRLHYFPADEQLVLWGTGSKSVLNVGPYFFVGAIYAMPGVQRWIHLGWALFLAMLVALFQVDNYTLMQFLMLLVLPYVTLAFGMATTPLLASAGRFGDPSYGIYLYGFPVQQAVFEMAGPGMGVWANTLVTLPIVFLLAYASWHLLEKRALALKPAKKPASP